MELIRRKSREGIHRKKKERALLSLQEMQSAQCRVCPTDQGRQDQENNVSLPAEVADRRITRLDRAEWCVASPQILLLTAAGQAARQD